MKTERKRILVVDDEASITRLLKINLEQTGDFAVRVENDAKHAMSAAIEFMPDLILLDVLMPGTDGGQLAARFQGNPRFAKVPILFLTAAATKPEVKEHHGKIGGLPFLAKPVDIPEVISAIREHLPAGVPD
ncbi:MAG: response regulator [Verrucomicrobiae bacterium]|nr:response regulator [Verrucomicrobiae bacterium]